MLVRERHTNGKQRPGVRDNSYFVARQVIVTGDDFGLSAETNAGIMRAYLAGVLTSASLMVSGDAAQEAVELALSHPSLAVGLHLCFSDTRPTSPPSEVPMLLRNGHFPCDERALCVALRSSRGRAQVRAEINAQFAAFKATGLTCDHVNVHRHAHLRPLLAWMVVRETARWGVSAIRIPWDAPKAGINVIDAIRLVRVIALRRLVAIHNLTSPDWSIGRTWDPHQLVHVLQHLKSGTSEIYCHPVEGLPNHMFANDLQSLLDDGVQAALRNVTLCSYQSARARR
jgi:chitin disaccharide deacetylase